MSKESPCFKLYPAKGKKLPILLSSPHSGTQFPSEIIEKFQPRFVETPSDTDLHIDKLYDFAPEAGMTLIAANYSRYVIDLNRDPKGQSLYGDGRSETNLVPKTTFDQEPLYLEGKEPDPAEISRRQELYYWPYYKQIKIELDQLVEEFGAAIFFDCHSIRRVVKSIREEPFPDLIIGTLEGKTIETKFESAFENHLKSNSKYEISNNAPFKGGHLTRYFGKPSSKIHGLQLEMAQDLYLNETTRELDQQKIKPLRSLLQNSLLALTSEFNKCL